MNERDLGYVVAWDEQYREIGRAPVVPAADRFTADVPVAAECAFGHAAWHWPGVGVVYFWHGSSLPPGFKVPAGGPFKLSMLAPDPAKFVRKMEELEVVVAAMPAGRRSKSWRDRPPLL